MRFSRAGDRLLPASPLPLLCPQDPNSLSNLDQDLPNNMIHQVRIKSLPQEWLWCETWCDDASKQYAKTIDLVSGPGCRVEGGDVPRAAVASSSGSAAAGGGGDPAMTDRSATFSV